MREILFRGKRANSLEWVEGAYVFDGFGHYVFRYHTDENALGTLYPVEEAFEVAPETVGQFTGKTDKNGERIFEGDILRRLNNDGTTALYEVVWDNEFFAPMLRLIGSCSACFVAGMNEQVEVIGNIHDNPELLEVSDDQ